MSTDRYVVYEGSLSGHCCFEFSIMDTTKPEIIAGKHYRNSRGQLQYDNVCECFTEEDALLICKALNENNR